MAFLDYTTTRKRLIAQASISETWLLQPAAGETEILLDVLLSDAVRLHNPNYSFATGISNVPSREEIPIRTLAHAQVQNARASVFSTQANAPSSVAGGFGTDRNTPYYKCVDLRDRLIAQYKEQCASLGIPTGSGGMIEGELLSFERMIKAQVPSPFNRIPSPSIGGQANIENGEWIIEWDFPPFPDFYQFVLFYDTGDVAIHDPTNQDSNTGYPQIRDDLEPAVAINNGDQRKVKLTGLVSDNKHRVLLVMVARNAKMSYSNEYTLTW